MDKVADFYTIGHSTLDLEDFTKRLRSHGITLLADIRSMPGSRRFPHFNSEALKESLPSVGIEYCHFLKLGGRRSPKVITPEIEESIAGWSHKSFKSYAAWTFTEDFSSGIQELLEASKNNRVAYMCSEAVPWKCHRSILSTVLVARGLSVSHIMDSHILKQHVLSEWGAPAVVRDGTAYWPHS